uniref:Serine hydroxymethyltransferase n=1 Tax=Parastrongyloides trichosuri TaxID=131310 RepID=A0A0N4ZZN5_PARTI
MRGAKDASGAPAKGEKGAKNWPRKACLGKLSKAPRVDRDFPGSRRSRRKPGQAAERGLRRRARSLQARSGPASVRRADGRRHDPARRRHRRDADRRRQDPGGRGPGLSERPGGQGRPRRHRQRLPGPPRRRDHGQGPAPDGLSGRHHLRHQQRIRLRLSARQSGLRPSRDGAARPPLRHRRRSRLHPDRRSAHPADHLRPDRGPLGPLQDRRRPGEGTGQGQGHLRPRREAAPGPADRAGLGTHGAGAGGRRSLRRGHRRPVRPGQRQPGPPRQPGPARQHPLSARQGLHHQGRRDRPDRRIHRPHDAGPSPVRRPAPGHRGQGRRQDQAREPDPGLGHDPELLPPLRKAVRHDRHRRDRGPGIPRHLQDGRPGSADQPSDPAQGLRRRGLSHLRREEPRHRRPDRRLLCPRPADPGRHRLDREVRRAVRSPQDLRLQVRRGRGRGHQPPLAEPRRRDGPEARRSPQLRHAQERAEVRRRRERSAQGRVRTAPGVHGLHRPVGTGRRFPQRRDQRPGRTLYAAQGLCRAVGHRRPGRKGPLNAGPGTAPA